MRAALLLSTMTLGVLACEGAARIRILDARTSRTEDLRVIVDVQLEAAEQRGGSVGPYCVSVNWFLPGFPSSSPVRKRYTPQIDGLVDSTEECASDLRDGDQRTFRLLSTEGTQVISGLPGRVQVRYGDTVEVMEGVFSP